MSERKLPRNLEAEDSVLGGCLIDNAQIAVAREIISTPAMFFRPSNGIIWEAIDDLDRNNYPVDIRTVVDELTRRKTLEKVNGAAAVAALVDGVPRATNVEHYARLVKDYWLRRGIILSANKLTALGYDSTDRPVGEIIAEAESMLLALSRDHVASDGFINAETWAVGGMQLVRQLMETKSMVTGLATGFKRLDWMTRGLQPGNLIIIAGRPSMGKTSLALQIARQASKEGAAGVISLEMNKNELWMRALSLESEIGLSKILTGDIDDKDGPKLMAAAQALEQSGFFIDETPSISAEQLRSRCKRLAVEHPLNLLVIDYMQLMDLRQRKGETLTTAVGRASRLLKQTARELHVPIILLSQLSRAPESRTDKRPVLSDLRDSGNLEQDADVVALMFREDYYFPDTEKHGLAEVILAKQRMGRTGTVELYFEKTQTRFLNWADRPGAQDRPAVGGGGGA